MAYVGLDELCEYNIGAADMAFDQVQGGEMGHTEGDDINHYDGIGGQYAKCRPGVVPGGNVETLLQDGVLLQTNYFLRSAVASLPSVITYIQGGLINVASQAKKQTSCYMDSVEIACAVGEPVTVTYNWLALKEEAATVASAATQLSTAIFCWSAGDLQIDSGTYQAQSFRVTGRNNLRPVFSLDDGTTNELRWPEEVVPGIFEAEINVDIRTPSSVDLMADAPTAFDFVFTASNGAKTFTFTSAGGGGFNPTSAPVPFVGGGDDVVWTLTGEIDHNDLSAWGVTLA